jgi:signal transduction histidine kinase
MKHIAIKRRLSPLPKNLRTWSLRSHLILLVVATILPLLAFSIVRQYNNYQQTREAAGQRVLELARNLSLAVDGELQVSIAALQALALSRPLQAGDFESFRTPLEALIAQQWPGAHALVLKQDGQQVFNSAASPGAPLPIRQNRGFMDEMFRTGQPVVSDLFQGLVVNQPVVSIDVPVRRSDGAIVYSLALNPNLETFASVLRQHRVPKGWVVSIFDRQGVNIARVPNGDRFVGKKASPSFLPYVLAGREALVENTSLEGTPVLSALVRSERFGWSIGMGLPQTDLTTPAFQSLTRTLAVGAIVLAISVLLAILVAGRITRPIAVLRQLAASPNSEERLNPPHIELREADEVAQALRTAEQKRQQSDDERQRAMSALRISDTKLQQAQKMEAIGSLTGGMAHDFNNLLGVIIGSLDLALPKVPRSPKVRELIEEAIGAALKGAELTQSLLAFARQQPLQPTTVRPNDLIMNTAKLLGRTFDSNIEISLDLAPDIWPVVVDRARFEAALLNLATNARDAMPNGGKLTIVTNNSSIDEDYAATQPDLAPGDYSLIQISDTGAGIAPDVLAKVFEPFYTTKALGKGTGLGLSMVFGFMKQSGGHINVYSELGKGTIFRLYLPRARADDVDVPVVVKTPSAGANQTVLVVDDNPALLRVCVGQLTELGYRVLQAENAAAALEIMESGRINLLFTDIMMPGDMNGLDLMRTVHERWPSIKVVVTSGFPKTMVDGRWTAAADTVRLLNKPYRKEELARAVHDALNQ